VLDCSEGGQTVHWVVTGFGVSPGHSALREPAPRRCILVGLRGERDATDTTCAGEKGGHGPEDSGESTSRRRKNSDSAVEQSPRREWKACSRP
jgi:hypothetical protein